MIGNQVVSFLMEKIKVYNFKKICIKELEISNKY